MDIHNVARLVVDLQPDQYFRATEPYGEDDREIDVRRFEIRSVGSVWAKGPLVRKDGSLGDRQATRLLDLDDLPEPIVRLLLRYMVQRNLDSLTSSVN